MKSQVLHTAGCDISGEAARGTLKSITHGSERAKLRLFADSMLPLMCAQAEYSNHHFGRDKTSRERQREASSCWKGQEVTEQ